jgi:uncharacterized protein (DUF1499 family)
MSSLQTVQLAAPYAAHSQIVVNAFLATYITQAARSVTSQEMLFTADLQLAFVPKSIKETQTSVKLKLVLLNLHYVRLDAQNAAYIKLVRHASLITLIMLVLIFVTDMEFYLNAIQLPVYVLQVITNLAFSVSTIQQLQAQVQTLLVFLVFLA